MVFITASGNTFFPVDENIDLGDENIVEQVMRDKFDDFIYGRMGAPA